MAYYIYYPYYLLNDMNNEISDPDPNIEYPCSQYTNSKGFTKLMKLVMMTGKNPDIIIDIKNMIKHNKNMIDIKNEKGWTALMIAARNSNTVSNIETVKILIDAGADLNLKNNRQSTALMLANDYIGDSSEETIKLLIETGADINGLGGYDTYQTIKMHTEYQIKLTEIKTIKKINFSRTLWYIPLRCNEIKFKDGNIGSKIMKLSFNLKTGKITPSDIYQKMVNKNSFILDYLSITSFDHFVPTIDAYIY